MEKILKQKHIRKSDILIEPNDILKEISEEVKIPLEKDDRNLLKIMYNHVSNSQNHDYSTAHGIRSAVGIAAIQMGIQKRLLAIKTTDEDGAIHKYMLANPKYTFQSDEIAYLSSGEGCLSVEEDKYDGIVPRHYHVIIEGYNLLTNKVETIDVKGYVAIVLQHEMDHLDGKLYFEKINKLNPHLIKDDWIVI